ncbi:TetR/AcrR family transcriptional regulator [Actinokineospora diospyrosa]|uniref:TetR/AcrR family transcriptional regulator n=1 Tax=Actinokineospora diospyrosa TaxID=103728 RepID=UPI0020A545AE|nr:TetR/AcrR family transcriptional regulator [Actinokineospora diospyrosa]
MTVPDTPYRVRRTPTQYRASRQIERILDAAARVVATKGYAATTTADIAKAATVSIGSVYRYFPDKTAVMRAVVERNTRRFQDRVLADRTPVRGWRAGLDRAYAVYVDMCRTEDGFRAISGAGLAAGELEPQDDAKDPLAEAFATLLVRHFAFTDTPALRTTLLQCVTLADVLTRLAFRLARTGHQDTLERTRGIIEQLLAAHEPAAREPAVDGPAVDGPAGHETAAQEPAVPEPATEDRVAVDPVAAEPTTVDPATGDLTAGDPTAGDPTAGDPTAGDSAERESAAC